MEIAAETDKTNRRSEARSWLAVLVLGLAVFGLLYGASALLGGNVLYRWFYRWEAWSNTRLALYEIVALALIILLAAVLAHGLERKRVERRALIVGSLVLYMPALVSSLFAAAGLSYLMWEAFVAGGVVSTLACLLMGNNPQAVPDWRQWIAVGRVGRDAIQRADSGAWHILALLIVAIGVAITILGFVQVFRAHRKKRLQMDGLYATVRHPQHLGIAIWTFGLAFAASTTAGYLTWFTVLFFYILLALWEEKRLSQQFGSIYDDYRRRTPFMIPFVGMNVPLPQSRWSRVAALAAYYVAGMAIVCLIMMAIGVDANLYV